MGATSDPDETKKSCGIGIIFAKVLLGLMIAIFAVGFCMDLCEMKTTFNKKFRTSTQCHLRRRMPDSPDETQIMVKDTSGKEFPLPPDSVGWKYLPTDDDKENPFFHGLSGERNPCPYIFEKRSAVPNLKHWFIYQVRTLFGDIPLYFYHHDTRHDGSSTSNVTYLPESGGTDVQYLYEESHVAVETIFSRIKNTYPLPPGMNHQHEQWESEWYQIIRTLPPEEQTQFTTCGKVWRQRFRHPKTDNIDLYYRWTNIPQYKRKPSPVNGTAGDWVMYTWTKENGRNFEYPKAPPTEESLSLQSVDYYYNERTGKVQWKKPVLRVFDPLTYEWRKQNTNKDRQTKT